MSESQTGMTNSQVLPPILPNMTPPSGKVTTNMPEGPQSPSGDGLNAEDHDVIDVGSDTPDDFVQGLDEEPDPDEDEGLTPEGENNARNVLQVYAGDATNELLKKLSEENINAYKLLNDVAQFMEWIPEEKMQDVEDQAAEVLMGLKDPKTQKPFFTSEAEARQFFRALRNKKRIKQMRWRIPELWQRLDTDNARTKDQSPMLRRTINVKLGF